LQILFPWEDEAEELAACGLARSVDFQYHWVNAGYRSPEEFWARFPSKRRNVIRRERAAPARQGITIRTVPGSELAASAEGWGGAIYDLHRAAVDRMVWGRRFLTRSFYPRVVAAMPEAVEVVEAKREGRLIAMAFNLVSGERLYGRYWGCLEEHPFLHFNVCLYHSIDDAIRRGLRVFEAGAGGDHKLSRGFGPAETWGAHTFFDARLDRPIRRYLEAELERRRVAVARWREQSVLKSSSPAQGP